MATFDISPLFRSTAIGFDRGWQQLNRAVHMDNSGYPTYDILRTGDEEFRISLAVPGFKDCDISIETRDGALWVNGKREIDPDHNAYLFKGIEVREFQRSFQLPEHVKVTGATLEAGMLHIDLYRELPDALRPRRIAIQSESQSASEKVIQDHSRAA